MSQAEDSKALTAPQDVAGSYQDDSTAVQRSSPDYKRLSSDDLADIARFHERGMTQRQIADLIGCSQPAVCSALKRMSPKPDVVQAVLRAQTIDAAEAWGKAITKAAERGDHRPARELIEAAHPELRPQQGNSGGGVGVTIVIGQPGQPVALPDVVVSTGLSPVPRQLPSESDTER